MLIISKFTFKNNSFKIKLQPPFEAKDLRKLKIIKDFTYSRTHNFKTSGKYTSVPTPANAKIIDSLGRLQIKNTQNKMEKPP